MRNFAGPLKIGIAVFVLGVILLFPARVAYHWFAPPQLQLGGISGTVWSGRAAEAALGGLYFRSLEWQFRPTALLTGKLGYGIESAPAGSYVKGDVAVGMGATVTASDIEAVLPLAYLGRLLGAGNIEGRLTASITEFRAEDGVPVHANGTAEITGLYIPQVSDAAIGGFKAEFFSEDSGITASIEDETAVIDLAGSLQLSREGAYLLQAQIGATSRTPAGLRQQLEYLGPANARGQRPLRLEGRL